MRIKLFESWVNDDSKDVEEFCKMYLMDLIDDNWTIRVEYNGGVKFDNGKWTPTDMYSFRLYNKDLKKWNDVKYTFIPFLHMFVSDYNISSDIVFRLENIFKRYTYEILLNKDLKAEYEINIISFDFEKKKP